MVEGRTNTAPVVFTPEHEGFTGSHARTLDEKLRVVLPAGGWRDVFSAGGGKLVPWVDALSLWTPRSFQEMAAEVLTQERMGLVPDESYGFLMESTADVAPDAQGRIGLPADLRHRVGIGDKGAEVLLVGRGQRIEIWDRSRREALRSAVDPDAAAKALKALKY